MIINPRNSFIRAKYYFSLGSEEQLKLNELLKKMKAIEKNDCWYITKHPTEFKVLCYAADILLEYIHQKDNNTINLSSFFSLKSKESLGKGISISDNYRQLKNCYYYGLLKNIGNGYENAIETETLKEVRQLTGGNYNDTSKYQHIINKQIELIHLKSELDQAKDIRNEYDINPVYVLLKILMELKKEGIKKISLDEFKVFVGTTKNYRNIQETIEYILSYRIYSKEITKEFDLAKNNCSDNRYNLVFNNLDYLEISKDDLAIKEGYEEIVKEKIINYEKTIFEENIVESVEINEPYNYLVFGAPGTGKSYLLEEKRKDHFHDDNFERVTFYDGYTYGQFVGSYKPKVKINKNTDTDTNTDKKEIITYEYIPGPFMKMLVKALKKGNENQNFLILIEELNRAKADSVFGDIFQLLDRDKDGESKYRIAISEDQEAYLKEQGLGDIEKLYIPKNLYIWATMNSADQGVYPLDTAFKRRWSYEYLTLNANEEYFGSIKGETKNKYKNYKINIGDKKEVEWNKFRKKINKIVNEGNASEDRMLAPFFLVPEDFKEIDGEEGKETFTLKDEVHKFKLLSYIFDDLLMYDKKSKSKIFKSEIKSFSELIETFNEDINGVYNDDFIKTIVDTEQPEKTEEAE